MVDVSAKPITDRVAVATGQVRLSAAAAEAVAGGQGPKGDVLAVARIAGIQAAKRTWELVPLYHPVAITGIEVSAELDGRPSGWRRWCTRRTGRGSRWRHSRRSPWPA